MDPLRRATNTNSSVQKSKSSNEEDTCRRGAVRKFYSDRWAHVSDMCRVLAVCHVPQGGCWIDFTMLLTVGGLARGKTYYMDRRADEVQSLSMRLDFIGRLWAQSAAS